MFLCCIGMISAQSKNFIDKSYLETTATTDTLLTPDRISLSITLTERDTKGKISVEELEKRMESTLKGIGIDISRQLSLTDIASNFKKYILRSTEIWKRKEYLLIVYDAETVGKVITSLESIDISNVTLKKTEFSKIEEIKIALRQKAIAKAKLQAETMLLPLNQQLGKAIFISDNSHNNYNNNVSSALSGRVGGIQVRSYSSSTSTLESNSIEIEFEKLKIESTVTVCFALE